MKKNWQIKKLGEVGKIFSGNSINEREKKTYLDLTKDGLYYVATKDISESIIEYKNGVLIPNEVLPKFKIAHKNSVQICVEGGSAGRKYAFNSDYDICFVNKLFAFEANQEILPQFVFYYQQSDFFSKSFMERLTGLIGGVSLQKFKEISISFPSLDEQKRIVKILDQKFAQIDALKQNAQANLNNAKALFQSELEKVFNDNNEMEIVALKEVAKKMIAGGDAPKSNYSKEKTDKYQIPIYANAVAEKGLYGYTDKASIEEPSVTIAARGSGTAESKCK